LGQEEMMDLLIVSILANGHSLMGVPGVAKTVTASCSQGTLQVGFQNQRLT
jgi:MoxR-like ATPase